MEQDPDRAFRRAIGAFSTGVAVVSAAKAGGSLSGITVNSLTSVSLKPRLLLWCLGDRSERYDVFAGAELWGLTVLGADDMALAQRLARPESETLDADEVEMLASAPVLRAGVAQFACRTYDRRKTGDHLIIVGEVLDMRVQPGDALTFFRGAFGRTHDTRSET